MTAHSGRENDGNRKDDKLNPMAYRDLSRIKNNDKGFAISTQITSYRLYYAYIGLGLEKLCCAWHWDFG